MLIQPNDILLAFKHIALSEQLNGTQKQFAAFLVDSYNRKTGRCDPSEETAAFLLKKSPRTIVRAGNRLVLLKLFFRHRYAGHNHCNSYQPNWTIFRKSEEEYKIRRKERANRFKRAKLSDPECQFRHPNSGSTVTLTVPTTSHKPVTQNSPSNHIQSTYPPAANGTRQSPERETSWLSKEATVVASLSGSPPSLEVAKISAQRRWNSDLLDRFRLTLAYAVILEELDASLQDAATSAELRRRGAGIACILGELDRRGVRWS
jgi:hypothetical protein